MIILDTRTWQSRVSGAPDLLERLKALIAAATLGVLAVALSSCGGMRPAPAATHGSGGGAGGASDTGGARAGTGGAAAGTGGAAGGIGGTSGPVTVAADFSGRWGMFTFEDPVGVQLAQGADGKLTGRGCAAGAPGGPTVNVIPGNELRYCGDIVGRVDGVTATFDFLVDASSDLRYTFEVTVSADGRRMVGVLKNRAGVSPPMAWLRVSDDAAWLPIDAKEVEARLPLRGLYDLTLDVAASTGTEYAPGRTYELYYWSRGIGGDLGGFWHTEMSAVSAGSPQRVGPVAPTIANLPISLTVEFDRGVIHRVTAMTSSGGTYIFSAKRTSTEGG